MPHIHEKIDFTADAFVVFKGKILLRKHDKYNIWAGIGGHVELHEDPTEAVIREAKEETGLDIRLLGPHTTEFDSPRERDLMPPLFLNRHSINSTHEHVDLLFLATTDTDEIKPGPGEKDVETHWFTKKELEDPSLEIPERIRQYALRALEESKKWI